MEKDSSKESSTERSTWWTLWQHDKDCVLADILIHLSDSTEGKPCFKSPEKFFTQQSSAGLLDEMLFKIKHTHIYKSMAVVVWFWVYLKKNSFKYVYTASTDLEQHLKFSPRR